jgi:zinc protease
MNKLYPLAVSLLLLGSAVVAAPPKKRPAGVPAGLTAQAIMGKYVAATGGAAAYAKIKSLVMSGSVEMKTQGIKGTFEMQSKDPDKLLVVINIPGFGEQREGYDGKIAWTKDPLNGVRELSGAEAEAKKLSAAFNSSVKWQELYKKFEVLGVRKVGSRSAYAVRMTPKTGRPTTNFYDTKTFLLLRSDTIVESPQGTFPTESYASDYRVVEGVKMPFVNRQRVGGIAEVLLTATEIKTNVPIDDAIFAKPAK